MARLDTNLKIGDRKSLEPDHELAVESCHTLAGSRNCHVRDVFSSCINVRPRVSPEAIEIINCNTQSNTGPKSGLQELPSSA